MRGENTWGCSGSEPQPRKGQELAAAAPFMLGMALIFLLLFLHLWVYCVGTQVRVLFLHFLLCLFAHVGEHVLRWVCVGNLWVLIFPFRHAGPRDLTQVIRPFSEHLDLWSCFSASRYRSWAFDLKAVLSDHLSSCLFRCLRHTISASRVPHIYRALWHLSC